MSRGDIRSCKAPVRERASSVRVRYYESRVRNSSGKYRKVNGSDPHSGLRIVRNTPPECLQLTKSHLKCLYCWKRMCIFIHRIQGGSRYARAKWWPFSRDPPWNRNMPSVFPFFTATDIFLVAGLNVCREEQRYPSDSMHQTLLLSPVVSKVEHEVEP